MKKVFFLFEKVTKKRIQLKVYWGCIVIQLARYYRQSRFYIKHHHLVSNNDLLEKRAVLEDKSSIIVVEVKLIEKNL